MLGPMDSSNNSEFELTLIYLNRLVSIFTERLGCMGIIWGLLGAI